MPKRCRKRKGSCAWKKLVRGHKRGPKRVNLSRPRRKGDVDPLTVPGHSKRIQIILSSDGAQNKIGVSVFNQVFTELGLVQYKGYTMTKNRLTRAGHALRKCLKTFEHNDFILGQIHELKLDNCVGRCIVMTGKFSKPDAILHIVDENGPTPEPRVQIKKMFESDRGDVEYM